MLRTHKRILFFLGLTTTALLLNGLYILSKENPKTSTLAREITRNGWKEIRQAVATSMTALPSANVPEVPSKDVISGTAITWWEIQANLARCQRRSIQENPQCRQVHLDARSFWRSTGNVTESFRTDIERMDMASSCCALNFPELMEPSLFSGSTGLYPWEKDYLSQGPLTDIRDTAWAHASGVTLLTSGHLKLGQQVQFLIQLRTGRGEAREKGGDIVRLWLVNTKLGASVAAEVKDNKNGRYLATVRLPWLGKVVVKATIAYTRELLRSALYVQRVFTTNHWITGVFSNSTITEATPCSSWPYLPAFPLPEVCNVTDANGGIPWYCGKPVKKGLTCQHYYGTQKLPRRAFLPLSEVEEVWTNLTETKRPFFIPVQFSLYVNEDGNSMHTSEVIPPPQLPCTKLNLSTTFNDVTSTGYFYHDTWYPFACSLPTVDNAFVSKCLQNTTVLILGDSNTRAQAFNLEEYVECVEKPKTIRTKWHAPFRCDNASTGMSLQYYPPKNPFYSSPKETVPNAKLTSAISKLDSIPREGRYLVLLHEFLHLITFHLSIARARVRQLRSAIVRLLARNGRVIVLFQSVHAAYDNNPGNWHKLNQLLFDVQRGALRDLGERVMLVNTLDMTIAGENHLGHPLFNSQFTRLYLGHVCGRL